MIFFFDLHFFSPPKICRTGPGDTHGCFNPIEYVGEGGLETTNEKVKTRSFDGGSTKNSRPGSSLSKTTPATVTKRNFYTNPTPKGGPGYAHITIGGFEYPYVSEPYEGVKKKKDKSKSKPITVPFRSMSPPGRGYDMSVFAPVDVPEKRPCL